MRQDLCYTIEGLTFAYPETANLALDGISLTIGKGEFVTICGKSGCGKTTLLRHLKPPLAPHGEKSGRILWEGRPLESLSHREQAMGIGFVQQSPENQIVTDKVWHELAFGLESLGYDSETIRLRVAEMASFFGIQEWFHQSVTQLSGGQKQLLNLASVMVMQPSVLILDEPTSQLDPIAAADFLNTVGRINRELGTTVILTEHRLEDALPLSDRVIVMEEGRVLADGEASQVAQQLKQMGNDMFLAMPAPMRIFAGVPDGGTCPVTVRDGRKWLHGYAQTHPLTPTAQRPDALPQTPPAISLKDVWFRYEKETPDIIKGLSLTVPAGAFFALVGGNGTGKSTTLSLISGILEPYRGEILLENRAMDQIHQGEKFAGLLGVLPQNPQNLFVKKTVALDLQEMVLERNLSGAEQKRKLEQVIELCELGPLLSQHPYDLSGGEQQRAALAKVLLLEPRILLLDEPTKGLDGYFKEKLARILCSLRAAGTTIFMVSHDVEFCARYADWCAMFFDGKVVSQGPPQTFFAGNNFYTTAANRMARQLSPLSVTAEDVIVACGGTVEPVEIRPAPLYEERSKKVQETIRAKKLPRWRILLGGVSMGFAALLVWTLIQGGGSLEDLLPASLQAVPRQWEYAGKILLICLFGILGAALLSRKSVKPEQANLQPRSGGKLSHRTLAAVGIIVLLIPATLYVGMNYFGNRKYYFISLLIVLETMIPFAFAFENRKPQARELVVLATLCALAVAGRAAFFFLPQFKPVAAVVILAAVAFGGEAGFLVGAVSMLISNFFFGQGPWTPYQMFATGIIGFLAGILFQKGWLSRSRSALCIFGGLSVFFIYGVCMNTYSVFQYSANVTLSMIVASCLTGVPMDLVYSVSTVIFLAVGGPAILEKLDRIKVKYGLLG